MNMARGDFAEGYIPSQSSFSDRALSSHETACILNAGERDANVAITIFFADRGPVSRLDSRRAEVRLLSTVAYAEG
jgi:hypothetical protein